jgi:DNA-binding CsgD family transcriptional regulator
MEPSITLSQRDLKSLLDLTGLLHGAHPAHTSPEPFVQEVLTALSRLVPCEQLFWNRLETREPVRRIAEIGLAHAPAPDYTDDEMSEWAAHRDEHPVMSGRWGPVTAVSEVYSRSPFHKTWLYQRYFGPRGIEDEIGVHLSHPAGQIHVVFLSRRSKTSFDERDHLVLALLRPHLDAAFRRLAFPAPQLTAREQEVLRLVRDGLTDGQIARFLAISEATVGKHLEHAYGKAGVQSRVQALAVYGAALDEPS